MQFSVLQSVYYKDNPAFLYASLQSILNNTVKPVAIILVKDGRLSEELESVITEWERKLPLKVVGYTKNQGLAYALNYGLQFVETELVARMDSDDICYPDRFEKQVKCFENNSDLALLSGYIDEFDDNPEEIVSSRTVPLDYSTIKKFLKRRNAFNHMAVMFKKSAVIASGNYQRVPYFEDYDLWIRMINHNFYAINIADKLVKARIGNDMIGRRHGIAYARHEVFFLKRQLKIGFITRMEYYILLMLTIPVRLLPKGILKKIYSVLRKI